MSGQLNKLCKRKMELTLSLSDNQIVKVTSFEEFKEAVNIDGRIEKIEIWFDGNHSGWYYLDEEVRNKSSKRNEGLDNFEIDNEDLEDFWEVLEQEYESTK